MNKSKLVTLVVGVAMVLAVACGTATPTTTQATASQTPIPTPTVTSLPMASTLVPTAPATTKVSTPTPNVTQEWELFDLKVDGSTVTVVVRVYAGVGMDVSLAGSPPSRVEQLIPFVEYIFEDVPAGEHPVLISDVVGFSEAISVKVEAPDPANSVLPVWLAEWVADLDSGKVEFPPLAILRFQVREEIVYYVSPQCCDQFSDLLDADGNLIGHPDGGITGRGDGVTTFTRDLGEGEIVWSAR